MTKANLKRLEEGKLYYSISEVCSMTGLEQHVLRYWESEFPQLRPKKNRSGNRAYRTKEIKIIRYIKYLLYEEMYTIPGAKKKMADANMSDLERQLSMIRVPGFQPPIPKQPAEAGPSRVPEVRQAREADRSETVAETAPNPVQNGFASLPEMENPVNGDSESHAHDGGPAAARLRDELKRVKQELQSLLSELAAVGRASP
ncbi:MAG: MerR family transcriptional regulator [Fibrobacteria bacterium]